jgi:hypothetical protein
LACTAWPVYVLLAGLTPPSVLLIVAILLPLLVSLIVLERVEGGLSVGERVFVWLPLSVYAGWISAATFVNVASSVKSLGGLSVGDFEIPERDVASALVIAAAGLAATFTFLTRGNIAYALTVMWALAWIVARNLTSTADLSVAVTAGGMLVLLGLGLVGATALTRPSVGNFVAAEANVSQRCKPALANMGRLH